MFCGMVMAKYVRPNLSHSTDDRVGAFFRVIASLAEIFVFVYIGCALFTEQQAWYSPATWAFIFFSLVALAISRYLNVYPCTAFINMLRPVEQRIPETHKHMLWFSGLRGAMAFALSMLARNPLEGDSGQVIMTSTFFMVRLRLLRRRCATPFCHGIRRCQEQCQFLEVLHVQVLITVLVNGGATSYMLRYWDLFDSEYSTRPARSPPPQRLQVLVPSRDMDDPDHDADYQNGTKISTTGSYATFSCQAHLESAQGIRLLRRAATHRPETRRLLPSRGNDIAVWGMSAVHPCLTQLSEQCHRSKLVYKDEASAWGRGVKSVGRYIGRICRNVIETIHDFQRQGGLNKQLEHLDKVFSSYLIAPDKQGDETNYVMATGTDPAAEPPVEEQ